MGFSLTKTHLFGGIPMTMETLAYIPYIIVNRHVIDHEITI